MTNKILTIELQAQEAALSATPQVQQIPAPLTGEQRLAMWHLAHLIHRFNASYDWYLQGIVDAEAAHEIGTAELQGGVK